ncbi:ECF transporter S component [Agromyces archimandritae]|uniref:ECF transporter S component n=1 Tax=Agromyces archimandritae TaxID=2781962 RepID=A0A975FLW3_9MICO|nr:ECF transporter S component [Agromyces archimandritae]QTX04302.1 ECF transporter S component [Agromyces archimandritae]
MQRTTTRVILSCAAIGVGGAIVAAGSGYLAAAVAAFLPAVYGLTIGTHFLPSVIALALLKRPGVAVLTGVIAGLVASAFAPMWFLRFVGTGLLVGALMELPFLLTRYRRWSAWMYYVAAAVAGVLIGVPVAITFDADRFAPAVQVLYLAFFALSPLLFTWIGRLIAASLARTGVARGI